MSPKTVKFHPLLTRSQSWVLRVSFCEMVSIMAGNKSMNFEGEMIVSEDVKMGGQTGLQWKHIFAQRTSKPVRHWNPIINHERAVMPNTSKYILTDFLRAINCSRTKLRRGIDQSYLVNLCQYLVLTNFAHIIRSQTVENWHQHLHVGCFYLPNLKETWILTTKIVICWLTFPSQRSIETWLKPQRVELISPGCPDGQSAMAAMAVVQLGFAINNLPSMADLAQQDVSTNYVSFKGQKPRGLLGSEERKLYSSWVLTGSRRKMEETGHWNYVGLLRGRFLQEPWQGLVERNSVRSKRSRINGSCWGHQCLFYDIL